MSASPYKLKSDITAYARSLGFGKVGITSTAPLQEAEKSLETWIKEGAAGGMEYMEKRWQTRARPAERLAGARSVIALAVSYYNGDHQTPSPLVGEGGDGGQEK